MQPRRVGPSSPEEILTDNSDPPAYLPPPTMLVGVEPPSLYGISWFYGIHTQHRFHLLTPGGFKNVLCIYQAEKLEVYTKENIPRTITFIKFGERRNLHNPARYLPMSQEHVDTSDTKPLNHCHQTYPKRLTRTIQQTITNPNVHGLNQR
jgi:hypothetical protein